MYGRLVPMCLLASVFCANGYAAEQRAPAVPEATPTSSTPRKPTPGPAREIRRPSVVLSTDELIKRYQLDVQTAIAVHELLRAQESKKATARGEVDAPKRLGAMRAVASETDDALGALLQGRQLQEVRQRVQERFQADAIHEAYTAGLLSESLTAPPPRDPPGRGQATTE